MVYVKVIKAGHPDHLIHPLLSLKLQQAKPTPPKRGARYINLQPPAGAGQALQEGEF